MTLGEVERWLGHAIAGVYHRELHRGIGIPPVKSWRRGTRRDVRTRRTKKASVLGGFGLRIKPSGIRSFILQYRNSRGASRRLTLGRFGVLTPDEARKIAKAKLSEVARGRDPAEERSQDRNAMTVSQLCTAYLTAAEKGLIFGKSGRPKRPSPTACPDRLSAR